MRQLVKYRYNVMDVDSPSAFAGIKGGYRSGCRDVYFVRLLGSRPGLSGEICGLDQAMSAQMRQGRLFYNRITQLPRLSDPDDINYYSGCYSRWDAGGGQGGILTRVSSIDEQLAWQLSEACTKAFGEYKKDKSGDAVTIRKNFYIKALYWFDYVCSGLKQWDERSCIKIAADNVKSRQQYFFYYILTLIGCDVLLIQSREDVEHAQPDRLDHLSKEVRIGNFSTEQIPQYQAAAGQTSINGQREVGQADRNAIVNVQAENRQTAVNVQAGNRQTAVNVQPGNSQIRAGMQAGSRQTAANRQEAVSQAYGSLGQTSDEKIGSDEKNSPDGKIIVKIPKRDRHRSTGALNGSNHPPQKQVPPNVPSYGGSRSLRPSNAGVNPSADADIYRPPVSCEKSFEQLAELASSIVMIAVHNKNGDVVSTGSGIMIGRNGYILTNDHVASGGYFYSVRIENDDKVYQTDELIKYHSDLDLALMRISRSLKPLPIYQGEKKLVRGQSVVAIGSPLGLFNSVSNGIISGFRILDGVHMIQFTAPISNGSSGGAVLNLNGEVIGISTAGFDQGQNINLAVGYESINMFVQGFRS